MAENIENEDSVKSTNHNLKYVLCFCLFFILGGVLGVFLTTKYLEHQDEDGNNIKTNDSSSSIDITDDKDYASTIESLRGIVSEYPIFYNSNGIDVETMDDGVKLQYLYNYIVTAQQFEPYQGIPKCLNCDTCDYEFVAKSESDDPTDYYSRTCDLQKISFDKFKAASLKLFGTDKINFVDFVVDDDSKCVIDDGVYLCGDIWAVTGVTGDLVPKFDIIKVTKEDDGSIIIYDKGYLSDTRSNIVNDEDGHDNYYLHSSDSSNYYFELKSADNLTFKHTFKMDADRNYYYYKTELVK